MNRGIFITLEGGEGAGKSTLMPRLGDWLKAEGHDVLLTREPGGSKLGETVREWLLKKESPHQISAKAELLLFLAARAQHLEERIIPALRAGKVVICDRFNDSTIAYQSAARGLDISQVKELCGFVCDRWLPNLTLFLDIDPQVGMRRAHKRELRKGNGITDRIEAEGLDFHNKVREAFILLAKGEPDRMKRLDASQSAEAVFQEALRWVVTVMEEGI